MSLFRITLTLLMVTLAGCANFTKIGNDASRYDSTEPEIRTNENTFQGGKFYVLSLDEDESFQALGKYDQSDEKKHRRFLLSTLEPKIAALGGDMVTSKDQADLVLDIGIRQKDEAHNAATQINFTASIFTLGLIPVHFADVMEIDINVSDSINSLSEMYGYKETVDIWFGGALTLYSRFGGQNKASAIDNMTNQFLLQLEEDGFIEEIIYRKEG